LCPPNGLQTIIDPRGSTAVGIRAPAPAGRSRPRHAAAGPPDRSLHRRRRIAFAGRGVFAAAFLRGLRVSASA